MTRHYQKPTSHIDPITGELVIRVAPATIAALTERWWNENSGEDDSVRIADEAGLANAVCANIHGFDEDWFPGDMSAVESWIGGSGCEALIDDCKLFVGVPVEDVVTPRKVYFGEWDGGRQSELLSNFDIHRSELTGVTFMVAGYDLSFEGGSAVVLFTTGGKLWKVYGTHIVDGDFRDQWKPVETTIDAMRAELPICPGAVRHEELIVSMHQALDGLEGIEPAAAPLAP